MNEFSAGPSGLGFQCAACGSYNLRYCADGRTIPENARFNLSNVEDYSCEQIAILNARFEEAMGRFGEMDDDLRANVEKSLAENLLAEMDRQINAEIDGEIAAEARAERQFGC